MLSENAQSNLSIVDIVPNLGPTERPDGISIEEAFNELSQEAFAIWVRLMTVPQSEMRLGRKHLSGLLRINRHSMNRYLRELRNNGYIRLVRQPGLCTEVILTRAVAMSFPNHFIAFDR